MSNVPQQLFVSGPIMKTGGGGSPNTALWLKALLRLWGKTLFSVIAARRCHSKYHQAEESGVMESPQTRISLSSSRRTVSESCARNNAECVIRAPRPRSDLEASSTVRRSLAPQPSAVPLKSCRRVFFACVRVPPVLSSRVLSGLSSLGRESQIHSHSDLPLGAVWDQRVRRSQQQVLHFYSRCHQWGFSQSQQTNAAPGWDERLLRWRFNSSKNGFHLKYYVLAKGSDCEFFHI